MHKITLVFITLLVFVAPGCLYEPFGLPRRTYPRYPGTLRKPTSRPPVHRPSKPPEYGPAAESGDRAATLLADEIAYREQFEGRYGQEAESSGLTALRMTADAADFVAGGRDRQALELLERAVAIDDSSGFAYLYLARVHFHAGSYGLSEEFLARARPLLPADRRLQRALDGLEMEIHDRTVAGASSAS